jgi:L-seryl-tRNA(Ser) seleniumtransferase
MRPPSVHALATALADTDLPHALLVDIAREAIKKGDVESARTKAEELSLTMMKPVINATGVLLHTNLGRAPIEALSEARYTNLEFDLRSGSRGNRGAHIERLLAILTGAEDALVVNNGAAALLLALTAIAGPNDPIIISRAELIEIGGGFRLPDILQLSGAQMVEVGTTNRTYLEDYRRALHLCESSIILKVHQSNFRIDGFTTSATIGDLKSLGRPILHDIGSGLLDSSAPWLPDGPPPWLASEPAIRQSLESGASIVTFSGDKLFGGPQAGILVGREDLIRSCARSPLYRTLRPGGLVIEALQHTTLAYLAKDYQSIPFWRTACTPAEDLLARANSYGVGDVIDCMSVAGGGSAPSAEIPSYGISVPGDISTILRSSAVPIIARVSNGATIADLRTVDTRDDPILRKALRDAILK